MKTSRRPGHPAIGSGRAIRAALAILASLWLLLPGQAFAASPLSWSSPELVDLQPAFKGPNGVSCPSASLCVVVDGSGNVLTSTAPTSGAETWTAAHVDGSNELLRVSCPTTTLCVAGDSAGNILSSTNPTGGAAAWTTANVDGTNFIEDVSCPSATFCAAVDYEGNILTSTNPTGGAGAWTATSINSGGEPLEALTGVACASSSQCIVSEAGNLLTSTNPTGGAGVWTRSLVDENTVLIGASCPTELLCVVADAAHGVATSTNPTGGAGAWTITNLLGGIEPYWVSCPSTSFCVAVGNSGNAGNVAVSTNPTGGYSAWSLTSIDSEKKLAGIACTTTPLCVTVDGFGDVMVGTEDTTPVHRLTVSTAGSGNGEVQGSEIIHCSAVCSHDYPSGSHVTLTATPASESTFTGWSGGGCSGTGACEVTMSADMTITATFTARESGGEVSLPNTVLGSHPPAKLAAKTSKTKVKFKFSSSTQGTTFKCKLDKEAFKPCRSPKTYKVQPGKHVFQVEAVDSAGADASPAVYRFRVMRRG